MSKTSSSVKDRYNRKAYDAIQFRIPKGQKQTIVNASSGYESLNAFIVDALLEKMHLSDWPDIQSASGKVE